MKSVSFIQPIYIKNVVLHDRILLKSGDEITSSILAGIDAVVP